MPQVVYGGVSASNLLLDDVYISVRQPQAVFGGSASAFNAGTVGASSWGPKNVPVTAGNPQALFRAFGPPINSGFDIVQEGALFLKQFPIGSVIGVRVTDGTDLPASVTLKDTAAANALILTAYYTGTFGNTIKVALTAGSNSTVAIPTYKIALQIGSFVPEVFDRIAPLGVGQPIWPALVAVINNTTSGSKLCVASLPGTPSTIAPAAAGTTAALLGGLDGTALTTSISVGSDGSAGARTGMYALRAQYLDAVWLCGNSDSTAWTTIAAFARGEKAIGYGSLPTGLTVSAAIQAKLAAGLDDPYFVLSKDYVTYLDSYLNSNVTVPPACVVAGITCSISPEQSPGNRVARGLIGTEMTISPNSQPYANSDLANLEAAGIMVITNPIPSANAFGMRHGKNTSSNFATSEIPYGRKTNDIIRVLGSVVLGQFVNKLQSTRANDPLRGQVLAALNGYFAPQKSNGVINDFRTQCDVGNNPPVSVRAGVLTAEVVVSYLAVVDKFICNLTAGQTVDVIAASSLGPN